MSKFIALCLCVMTTTGCIATHRSNTDWYEETTHVGIINKPPPRPKAEGVVPAPLVFAGELALKAAAAAFKWEGSKYVKDSSGELREGSFDAFSPIASETWGIEPRGGIDSPASAYIAVMRSVRPKEKLGFWESVWRGIVWFERPTKLEPLDENAKQELVRRVQACDSDLARVGKDEILAAFGLDKPQKDTSIGFLGLLQLTPTKPHARDGARYLNYRIELVDYRYSSLKAKNLSWIRVPFTDWEKTKSVLTMTLLGPKSDMHLLGNQYTATTEFEVKWDREKSSGKIKSEWNNTKSKPCTEPLQKSPPIRAYDLRNVGIAFKLSEAGTLKEAFEKAAEKVGDLDPGKIFGE